MVANSALELSRKEMLALFTMLAVPAVDRCHNARELSLMMAPFPIDAEPVKLKKPVRSNGLAVAFWIPAPASVKLLPPIEYAGAPAKMEIVLKVVLEVE